MATYANGAPSWIDLASPDPDASLAFYSDLFGWSTFEPVPAEQSGGYRILTKDGKSVGGIGPTQEGQPARWTTYLAADDADASVERVEANGGMAIAGPMDVFDAGRMAILADPAGAVFGVWQARRNTGIDVKGEPGTLFWNELLTRDVERAKRFYQQSFDFELTEYPAGGRPYTAFNVDGQGVAGILDPSDRLPPESPDSWLVYFAVDDPDAIAQQATSIGGSTVAEPFDVEYVGRMAWLIGPDGEMFGVISRPASGG